MRNWEILRAACEASQSSLFLFVCPFCCEAVHGLIRKHPPYGNFEEWCLSVESQMFWWRAVDGKNLLCQVGESGLVGVGSVNLYVIRYLIYVAVADVH